MSEIRDQLIKHAIHTIQKDGIQKLTIRELGHAVNIKSSSVMYHFKSKDELMSELVKLYNESFFSHLHDINSNEIDPLERIKKLINLYEDSLRDEKLCLCGLIAAENNNLDQRTKSLVIEFFDHIEEWLSQNLALLKKDKTLAKVILSSLNGAMIIDNLKQSQINYFDAVKSAMISLLH